MVKLARNIKKKRKEYIEIDVKIENIAQILE